MQSELSRLAREDARGRLYGASASRGSENNIPGLIEAVQLRAERAELLGFVDIFDADQYCSRINHLGPDILDPDWDREEAVRRLRARPERSIGTA